MILFIILIVTEFALGGASYAQRDKVDDQLDKSWIELPGSDKDAIEKRVISVIICFCFFTNYYSFHAVDGQHQQTTL